ncbi:hypothetical protein A4G99_08145 [Haladaptatus sp. R4]|nr:hypothetical protein A4G99_08145 [Haladaptatus sp. R4]
MEPQFTPLLGDPGIEIYDPIEKVRFELQTPRPVEPTPADADSFYYPIDSAVTIETDEIVSPVLASVTVYSGDGEFVRNFTPNTDTETRYDKGRWYLQINGVSIVVYLSVSSPVTIRTEQKSISFSFAETSHVRIGARSYHESPQGTITVSGSVQDTMRALSTFGSALKMMTPDRAHPTLRGHPPLIELGDEFHVPDSISRPDTDVRLELPLTHRKVFPAASLAYYLGAEVVPTSGTPKLVAGNFEYSLLSDCTYEETIHRILKQILFLDCIINTDGIIQSTLHERNQVESLLDFEFAEVYESSHTEQLETYLSVPYDTISEYVPTWPLTTDLTPFSEHAAVLPFLAYDLSLIRSAPVRSVEQTVSQPQMLDDFYRTGFSQQERTADTDIFRGTGSQDNTEKIVHTDPVETTEHAWIGDGFPLGANKLTVDALKRRFEYAAPNKSNINIRVVCNENNMSGEIVEKMYEFHDLIDCEVKIYHNRTVSEIRDILETPADLFHYIGHVDKDGFLCEDGSLDASTLDNVAIKAFFLNACSSYEQGMSLIEKGSIGGVVTLADVPNTTATRVGQTFAGLLNAGFSLRTALSIARRETVSGYRYITLGNGSSSLVQPDGGVSLLSSIKTTGENSYNVEIMTYPNTLCRLGSTYAVNVLGTSSRTLVSNGASFENISLEKLKSYLNIESEPIIIDGQILWQTTEYFE